MRVIINYLDQLAPVKEVLISHKESFREPWVNVKLCKLNSKCKKLFRKAHIRQDFDTLYKAKSYRRALNRLKLFEKREFYKQLFCKIGKDSHTLWSVLNSLIKKTSNKQNVTYLTIDGLRVSDSQTLCNRFNEHFVSIGSKVQSKVPDTNRDPLENVKRVEKQLLLGHISEGSICRIVDKLKNKLSTGVDGISNNFLKRIVNCIKLPLCIVFNKSLDSGEFPESMKIARVCALHKGVEVDLLDNYRPISLLPVFSKILERHVYLRLSSHMEKNVVGP